VEAEMLNFFWLDFLEVARFCGSRSG